ncbi:uncharacterized protein LOC126741403 [Anthonomus grandis grandis]|uniref:uncharacterized protein LOC126741403 n=1 Tax=Anthonomus grandis grandis TaxID=2921223 RepID=UPI002165BC6C|nr:uncharacterized protein LOC126741403 [Anthonomus grandis grandis]
MPSTSKASTVGVLINDQEVLLATVLVKIKDAFDQWHTFRAVLDGGAQSSFISKNCANKLHLSKFNISMSLHGLNSMYATAKKGVHCIISSIYNSSHTLSLDAVILDKICDDLSSVSFSKENFTFPSDLQLADPYFYKNSQIDLLLGNDIFPYILQDGKIDDGPDKPVCIKTYFGWTITGKTSYEKPNKTINTFFTTCSTNNLNQTLQNFWQIEEVPEIHAQSKDDEYCENYFLNTTYRTESGRYVVSLPFKITAPDFGDTYSVALRRFLSLEKRFLQDKDFHASYSDVIKDYLDNNHLQEVTKPFCSKISNYFYISHHAVFKKDSTSTPLRVVFDASSCASNKLSLNKALHTGPKLQQDLLSLLLNFRLHKYTFTCDLKQMFRNILLNPKDRNYQRILWRFSPNEPILHYQLDTVTFGVVCSPFLAIRTLLMLADDYKDLPLASDILKSSSYVDDLNGGGSSPEELIAIKNQLVELLSRGGFEARKWASNCPLLLKTLPKTHVAQDISFDQEENITLKILGLKWNPIRDSFFYKVIIDDTGCTKRTLLSHCARVFDPCGYLTPITISIKLLIKSLWIAGIDWDERPPSDIITKWNKFKTELNNLHLVEIPRQVDVTESKSHELFGFCDASERAYCAVVYIRVFFSREFLYKTYLVCAKSKVSPLKVVTLARLELLGAVLLSKLMHYVLNIFSHKIKFTNIFSFTDSSVALTWIKSSPHHWQTFVSNRVSYIQEKLPPEYWHHVPSELNPADCGSRGLCVSELADFSLWWNGPSFLLQNREEWSFTKFEIPSIDSFNFEKRKTVLNTLITQQSPHFIESLIDKYNSLPKIKRIVAYILRASKNFQSFKIKATVLNTSYLTLSELNNALYLLIKFIQNLYFAEEITLLRHNKRISKSLQKLRPFLDKEGYLRVGGRLHNSDLSYDKRFPLLLPGNCKFTSLLINELHLNYLHCGIQTTLNLLFQNYWIISAKRIVRKVIHKCHICWKVNPKPYQPPMGNLPKFRVSANSKAFINCGLDLCGPFPITIGRLRGAKVHKAYVCLFICTSTKGVHLELLSDLSAEAFLAGLRRFVARRGKVLNLYSDCGTNFIASEKYLRQIFLKSAEVEPITWHFNPPSAPHMGGIWEANIKSIKTHLVRVVGTQILTYEEFNTVIIQIEAVLNSRPLSPISSDPSDLLPLTPGHFLTLQPLTVLPDPDFTNTNINRLTRWQLLLRLHRDFWRRWHCEYLHTLQQRAKWHNAIGRVVRVLW